MNDEGEVKLDFKQDYIPLMYGNKNQWIFILPKKMHKTKVIWYVNDFRKQLSTEENFKIINSKAFNTHNNISWEMKLYKENDGEALSILLAAINKKGKVTDTLRKHTRCKCSYFAPKFKGIFNRKYLIIKF